MGADLQQSSQMSQMSADAEVYLVLKNIWKAAYQIIVSNCRHLSSKCNQGQLKLHTKDIYKENKRQREN